MPNLKTVPSTDELYALRETIIRLYTTTRISLTVANIASQAGLPKGRVAAILRDSRAGIWLNLDEYKYHNSCYKSPGARFQNRAQYIPASISFRS